MARPCRLAPQVGGYLGYTGRCANLAAKAACDPKRTRGSSVFDIQTAKLNDVDPQAWLADVLARINDHAIHRLDQLLPWAM